MCQSQQWLMIWGLSHPQNLPTCTCISLHICISSWLLSIWCLLSAQCPCKSLKGTDKIPRHGFTLHGSGKLNACATCHAKTAFSSVGQSTPGYQAATQVMAANNLFLGMSATESLCGSLNQVGSLNQFQKGLKWSPRIKHAVCFLSTLAIEALEQPLVPAFKHWTEIYRWNFFPTVHVRNRKPWHCGHDGLCVLLHRYVPHGKM